MQNFGWEAVAEGVIAAASTPLAGAQQEVDRLLLTIERTLTRDPGLPKRPWFTHHVYAPGYYTGYAVKTLPAVREAIEQRQWKDVGAAVDATAGALDAFAAQLERASAALAQ